MDSSVRYRGSRGIYVRDVPPSVAVAKLSAYGGLLGGRKTPHAFVVSEAQGGWLVIGVPAALSAYHFHNLLIWMTGLPEDAVRPGRVLAVNVRNGAEDYFLVPEPGNEWADTAVGRRADGAGIRIDVPAGQFSVDVEVPVEASSIPAFLVGAGVPDEFAPDAEGIAVDGGTATTVMISAG